MNLLIFESYFYPEETPFTHLGKDLIKELVNRGHEITVICPVPSRGISKQKAKEYRKIKREKLYGDHVKIIRFWAPKERRRFILRTIRFVWCNLRGYCIGKKIKDIEYICSGSTPPTQGYFAGKLGLRFNVPVMYLLQDIFPDSMVNSGMVKKNSFLWKLGRTVENNSYKNISDIIVISEDFRNNLLQKGIDQQKIHIIPNWGDTDGIKPIARKENIIIKKYSLNPEMFYITYCGTIGYSQNMELLVKTAKTIEKIHKDIRFIIIGNGVGKQDLENTIERENINNIVMLPFQDYKDIAHVFSLGDVGLVISKPGIGMSSVPGKTWNIMAAHKPILASFDVDSQLSKIVKSVNCGIVVRPDSETELTNAIEYMYKNKSSLKKLGENGYRYLNTELSKEKCVNKYISIIEKSKSQGVMQKQNEENIIIERSDV